MRTDRSTELDRLIPSLYERLRRIARSRLAGRTDTAAQPTALVHETFLRLRRLRRIDWQGRTHVYAVAVQQMALALKDQRRRRIAQKRGGGGAASTTWDEANWPQAPRAEEVVAVDRALARLEETNPRAARVAELRMIEGASWQEVSRATGISERTAREDWTWARAWLAVEMRGRQGGR